MGATIQVTAPVELLLAMPYRFGCSWVELDYTATNGSSINTADGTSRTKRDHEIVAQLAQLCKPLSVVNAPDASGHGCNGPEPNDGQVESVRTQLWQDVLGVAHPPNWSNDQIAPPVDEEAVRRFFREEPNYPENESVLVLVLQFRSWARSMVQVLMDLDVPQGLQEDYCEATDARLPDRGSTPYTEGPPVSMELLRAYYEGSLSPLADTWRHALPCQ